MNATPNTVKVFLVRSAVTTDKGQEMRDKSRSADQSPASGLTSPVSSWIEDLLDELTAFPNGTHDDQIDAISLAVHMAAKPKFRSGGMLIT
jgi:predicted phage terminase large subunit-like protein